MKALSRVVLLLGCLVFLLPAHSVSAQADPTAYCRVQNTDKNVKLVIAVTDSESDCGEIVQAIANESGASIDWDWVNYQKSDGTYVEGPFTYAKDSVALRVVGNVRDPRLCWIKNTGFIHYDRKQLKWKTGTWIPVAFQLENGFDGCTRIAQAISNVQRGGTLRNGKTMFGVSDKFGCVQMFSNGYSKCSTDASTEAGYGQ